ncbi:MAG: succinyl-diaminopimelate desuccinylase, partial [Proteobacteria bacterium]|nr:succinyl-diaminopimelate desuccinylase [Pseudomonadota bacterium]
DGSVRGAQGVGSVALLLTSDEEGPGIDGTRLALERLTAAGVQIDHCLIGEPTSSQRCGDIIKIGRRGSLSGRLTVHGKQGHIAYPHLADNPIHALISRLGTVIGPALDQGGGGFEPSSLQLSAIHAGVASNVIPGLVNIDFNIRFNPTYSAQSLRQEIDKRLKHSGLTTNITWHPGHSEPFISQRQDLANTTATIIAEITGLEPAQTTGGGTSDGRYISLHCQDLVEFGPINDTIHQANERVGIEEIKLLEQIYTAIIARTLGL